MKNKSVKFLILLFSFLFLFTGCSNSNVEKDLSYKNDFSVTVDKPSNRVSMITAGDALIHSSVYQDAFISGDSYDFKKMIPSIKNLVSGYDLKYYNQEEKKFTLPCLGDTRVRGGSGVYIDIAELGLKQWALVDKVNHKFKGSIHTMDLELIIW